MKKYIIFIACICLLLTACSKAGNDKVTFTAVVLDSYDNGLSVFTLKGANMNGFEPLSVHYDKGIEASIGDIVEIRFDGTVAESYPGQIWAKKVRIIEKRVDNWPATKDIAKDYPYEDAIKDKNFVLGFSEVHGEELLESFINHSSNGIIAYLRKVNYTVEGDPIITDILFDGQNYHVFNDNTRDKFAGSTDSNPYEYKYLNTYQKDGLEITYLANRNDITNEEYEKSMESDKEEDKIEQYVLYYNSSDIKY